MTAILTLSLIPMQIATPGQVWKVFSELIGVKEKHGAEGGTRTRMDCSTRPSNVRVYQFHHFGTD
jgi:hypothetical protein